MNSKLVLYNVPFNEDENKLIENIASYLTDAESSGGTALESTYPVKLAEDAQFQFIKHKLNLEIKISATQLFAPAFNANYCSITNTEYDESGEEPALSRYSGTYYYFITEVISVAEHTLKLTLKCDVLNTFGVSILDNTNWLPETFVEREHRDRFFDDDDYLFEKWHSRGSVGNSYYVPLAHIKVDAIPEDIDLPLYKTNEKKIKDIFNNKPFYLVYKASTMYEDGTKPVEQIERDNAIRCFLVAGSGTEIPMMNYYGNAVDLSVEEIASVDFADLNTGEWVFLDSEDNPDMLYSIRYKPTDEYRYYGFYCRELKKAGYELVLGIQKVSSTNFHIFCKMFSSTSPTTSTTQTQYGGSILTYQKDKIIDVPYSYYISGGNVNKNDGRVGVNNAGSKVLQNVRKGWFDDDIAISDNDNLPTALQTWANWKTYKAGLPAISFTENAEIVNMKTIDDIDRTDSRIVKIIELPYAPNAPHKNGSGNNVYYDFGDNWTSSADLGDDIDMANCFQLAGKSMEKDFQRYFNYIDIDGDREFAFSINCIRDLYNYMGDGFITPRVSNLETKLQHSDFYKPVIYYDNFSTEFKCERRYNTYHQEWVNGSMLANYLVEDFAVYYAVANNVVNGLIFSVSDMPITGNYTLPKMEHYECEDYYPLTMVCIRNNEVNIYNSAYLQYIRGGYNYDVKSKKIATQLAEHNAVTSFGSSLILSGGSNPMGVINAFWSYERQKEAIKMQAKQYQVSIDKSLKEASLRATSVSGSDNLDLLKHYAGNVAYTAIFKLNELWSEKVATLLHYFGYATNMNKVPNLTGRLFFNYVKCTPVFKSPLSILAYRKPNWPIQRRDGVNAELQNEVCKKFESGVSIIHRYLVEVVSSKNIYDWNVSQDKENWENFLEPLRDKTNFEQ